MHNIVRCIIWDNCLIMARNMGFYVSHIYREGNACADGLANYGLHNIGVTWWDCMPRCIASLALQNKMGLPMQRFSF